jgi:hypothetical protein
VSVYDFIDPALIVIAVGSIISSLWRSTQDTKKTLVNASYVAEIIVGL